MEGARPLLYYFPPSSFCWREVLYPFISDSVSLKFGNCAHPYFVTWRSRWLTGILFSKLHPLDGSEKFLPMTPNLCWDSFWPKFVILNTIWPLLIEKESDLFWQDLYTGIKVLLVISTEASSEFGITSRIWLSCPTFWRTVFLNVWSELVDLLPATFAHLVDYCWSARRVTFESLFVRLRPLDASCDEGRNDSIVILWLCF